MYPLFYRVLFVWHAELVLYSLVSIDKAGTFPPSFNNLSRISLPNMLGFINLNKFMDFITFSESLEGFPRPPWLTGEYVPYAYVWYLRIMHTPPCLTRTAREIALGPSPLKYKSTILLLISVLNKGRICAARVRLIFTNNAHSAMSDTNCSWDCPRSLSAQIQINYPSSDFRTERFTWPELST